MQLYKNMAIFFFFISIISGCSAPKVEMDFNTYIRAPLEKAAVLPARGEINNLEKKTVVVFSYDNSNANLSKESNIKNKTAATLENYIANVGVELVSRQGDKDEQLREEAKLYRLMSNERGIYNGQYKADYFIMGLINSIGAKGEFYQYKSKEETERKCNYIVTISGSIRVYNMLERKIVQDIRFDTNHSSSENTRSSNCPIRPSIKLIAQRAVDIGLGKAKAKLQNFFASRAYILEKRTNGDRNIFKVSMGDNNNLKPGDNIDIYTREIATNSLTRSANVEERKIAEGKVTDFVTNTTAWITVPDKVQANRIRLGDLARVRYQRPIIDRIFYGR